MRICHFGCKVTKKKINIRLFCLFNYATFVFHSYQIGVAFLGKLHLFGRNETIFFRNETVCFEKNLYLFPVESFLLYYPNQILTKKNQSYEDKKLL